HPKIPTRTALLRERNEELKEIAHDAKSSKLPIIVFGDMNCTSFSCYFTDFMQDGGLIDTEQGFGVQPSWNALLLTPILPIDHCFTSPQFV
ncbi:endonuclease/exonuclease/phosphatase family protein, partial [Acinetobacter baumannii]